MAPHNPARPGVYVGGPLLSSLDGKSAMATWNRTVYDSGRPLSPEVVETLQALLAGNDPVFAALREQIPFARAVSRCPCGCPSVGLEVDRISVPAAPSPTSPIASGWYDDQTHDVVLFTDDGYLSSLELNCVSDEVPMAWPDPSLLIPEPRRR